MGLTGSETLYPEGNGPDSKIQANLNQLQTEINDLHTVIEQMAKRLEPISVPKIQITTEMITADRITYNGEVTERPKDPQNPSAMRSQLSRMVSQVTSASTKLGSLMDSFEI